MIHGDLGGLYDVPEAWSIGTGNGESTWRRVVLLLSFFYSDNTRLSQTFFLCAEAPRSRAVSCVNMEAHTNN